MHLEEEDDDDALKRFAESVLPAVAVELWDPVWSGLTVSERGDAQVSRVRLEHRATLHVEAERRTYSVAANLFEAVGRETALHDHRYPLAVFPFSLDDDVTSALYEMQWVDARNGARSLVTVLPGARGPWPTRDACSTR